MHINGYIQQSFLLPCDGTYELNYLQEARNSAYSGQAAEIYWDGVLITTAMPNTTEVTNETILINTTAGNHTLKFQEIGDLSGLPGFGLVIDEVSLYFVEPDNYTENGTFLNEETAALNLTNNQTAAFNQTNNQTVTLNQTNNKNAALN